MMGTWDSDNNPRAHSVICRQRSLIACLVFLESARQTQQASRDNACLAVPSIVTRPHLGLVWSDHLSILVAPDPSMLPKRTRIQPSFDIRAAKSRASVELAQATAKVIFPRKTRQVTFAQAVDLTA